MYMNPYCNPLSLSIPPLIEEFDINRITTHQSFIDIDNINPKIKDLLYDLGIDVSWVELFYRKPGHQGTIHADNLSGNFTKINWVFKGKNSKMFWFTINDTIPKKQVKLTMASTEYLQYSLNEVTYVHSCNISSPSLVQVGIPHLVTNPTEDRYCLCFVLTNLDGKRLTMQEAQHLLKNYIQPT